MYFDQYCYVACSEKLFFSPVIPPPPPHPPLFISRPKTPNEVVQAQENWLWAVSPHLEYACFVLLEEKRDRCLSHVLW